MIWIFVPLSKDDLSLKEFICLLKSYIIVRKTSGSLFQMILKRLKGFPQVQKYSFPFRILNISIAVKFKDFIVKSVVK